MKTYNELAAQTWQKIARRKTANAKFYKRLTVAAAITMLCVFMPAGAYFLSEHTPFKSTPTSPPLPPPVSEESHENLDP